MTTVLARLRDRPVPECMFGSGGIQGSRAATVFPATEQMLDALLRLLRLADEGAGAAFMAPLVKEELYFRLLMSPAAGAFRALFSSGRPRAGSARPLPGCAPTTAGTSTSPTRLRASG